MPLTTYTYSISADFPSGNVNTTKLDKEIRASAITIALNRIDTVGNVLDIVFNDSLPAGDKTILDNDTTGPAGGLIAVHDNTPSIAPSSVQLTTPTGNSLPIALDGSLAISASESISDANRFLKVSDPYTIFANDQVYQKDTLYYVESLTGAGSASTYSPAEACVNMILDTIDGGNVTRQTKYYFPSHISRASTVFITVLIGAPKTNVRKRVGYYDANDGLFLEQTISTLNFIRRLTVGGVTTDTAIPRSSWNIDKLDGTGVSGITLDLAKIQTLVIDFSWPSRARFGFQIRGSVVYCHGVSIQNSLTNVGFATANLPCRWEIENTGTAASGTTMKQYGCSVLSDSMLQEFGHITSVNNGVTTRTAPATIAALPLISVRLKATTNRALLIPLAYSILTTTAARHLHVEIRLGGSITGGSWSSASPAVEVNSTGTALVGGIVLRSCYVPAPAQGTCEEIRSTLWAAADMAGTTDPVTLLIGAAGGTAAVVGSLDWREIV
jgi:hypothetical protein